jgi:hypothetical protein
VLHAGGVVGSGDETADDERLDSAEEPGVERPGVESFISSSALTRLRGVREGDRREVRVRVRLEIVSDVEDPDDSSKERLGDL